MSVDNCNLLLLITGSVQTLPSQLPLIVTMHGPTTERAWGSRHAPLAEGEGKETRRKWEESSSRATTRDRNGRRNKRSESKDFYMKTHVRMQHSTRICLLSLKPPEGAWDNVFKLDGLAACSPHPGNLDFLSVIL